MPDEISVHDNLVLSYTIDSQEQRITLRTIFQEAEPPERTDVVFTGVLARHFECDTLRTILFEGVIRDPQ